jgi:hypothetical protein
MRIKVTNPISIKVTPLSKDKPVLLQDSTGLPYYYRQTNCPMIDINLPLTGSYIISNVIEVQENPLIDYSDKAKTIELPEEERIRFAKKITFDFKDFAGKSPARIFAPLGRIEINKKNFKDYPFEWSIFIYYHEIGHVYYSTEWKCDLFAFKAFLMLNFNPSQSFLALSKILNDSKQSQGRIERLFETIQNLDLINND